MRGQKCVEDARERAYDPRIHLLRKNFLAKAMDCIEIRACPNFELVSRHKSGKPDLWCQARQ
jgi:hypothetical protein